jgi:hypothetical protein
VFFVLKLPFFREKIHVNTFELRRAWGVFLVFFAKNRLSKNRFQGKLASEGQKTGVKKTPLFWAFLGVFQKSWPVLGRIFEKGGLLRFSACFRPPPKKRVFSRFGSSKKRVSKDF